MLIGEIQLRVRYAETDKMGYVYHGNYATYLEVARVEMLRELGIVYKDMEDEGVLMPLLDFKLKFIRPAKYDDLLTIKTKIEKRPSTKVFFTYEIFNQENVLLTIGETTLVFIDSINYKPIVPPKAFEELVAKYFDDRED